VGRFFSDHPELGTAWAHLLPVAQLEVDDISEATVYLCGRSGRYVTGVTLPVDAGYLIK
jgi:hypothetical protein